MLAHATEQLRNLVLFRGVNPLYGMFLVNQLGIANREERIQAMESVLELPVRWPHFVRVPQQDEMPPGPLATERLDPRCCNSAWPRRRNWSSRREEEEYRPRRDVRRGAAWVLTLADKLRRLFDYDFPGVQDLHVTRCGRPARCWSSAATSTSTSPARACKSRRGSSSATCCG